MLSYTRMYLIFSGIDEAYPGKCECSCHIYGEDWVCGKNGFSYFNICQMGCEYVLAQHFDFFLLHDPYAIYANDAKISWALMIMLSDLVL